MARILELTAVLIALAGANSVAGEPAEANPATPAAVGAAAVDHPFPRRVPAPELTGGTGWVNAAEPLSLAQLRGKFVLLDFWTYCCINCIHQIPELEKLERAYPHQLVVVGVHSAKFDGEQDIQNIRDAVLRYEIEHPVVNDPEMAIWHRYGVRSWPTMVLIDPNGEAVWIASGEKTFEELRQPLELGIAYYRQQGQLNEQPRRFETEASKAQPSPLKFPGKVLADEASDRLFIADSNHNRIVVATLEGELITTIGSGLEGRADGTFQTCQFHHPQGMALDGDKLYVADTENHLLREVDLTNGSVTTIAGTGQQARGFAGLDPTAAPTNTSLASPWALWIHEGQLYVAMAGTHQIWIMPLDKSSISPYAGNGREDVVDGRLLPRTPYRLGFSSFAQPSGLASDGERLFVADSEGSTIRAVPFDRKGKVETLVGLTNTLFDFGDVDGVGDDVRLQHALGVAWHGENLYVADTYNNKIKVLDVEERSCKTFAGNGESGHADAESPLAATFDEPAGLTAAAGKLYVADTNNHLIRVIDLEHGNRVSTLAIEGLAPLPAAEKP
ncbi:MAG: thioredoxin-like domain-containing protein [Pirellulales bacterium]